MKQVKLIVAYDEQRIIGHGIHMPGWSLTDDFLLNFVPKTKGCPVIMGRITAESFEKGPLPGRTNIVISRDLAKSCALEERGFIVVTTLYKALAVAEAAEGDTIWIIGGAKIYALAMEHLLFDEIHITKVDGSFPGKDPVFFPEINYDLYQIDLSQTGYFHQRVPFGKDRGNSHSFTVEVYRK